MSNKLYIVAFVVLILATGGIAFFVKKQLDKKKAKSKEQEPTPTVEEPATKPREIEKPKQVLEIDANIHIEAIDTTARTFGYGMTYNGIAISGVFKDGDKDLKIPKSFGSFVIEQRMPDVTILAPIKRGATTTKGGATQTGNATTKGGATQTGDSASKLGKTGDTIFDLTTSRPLAKVINSDFVDLSINDKYGAVRTLTINLATGAMVGGKSARNWDGD